MNISGMAIGTPVFGAVLKGLLPYIHYKNHQLFYLFQFSCDPTFPPWAARFKAFEALERSAPLLMSHFRASDSPLSAAELIYLASCKLMFAESAPAVTRSLMHSAWEQRQQILALISCIVLKLFYYFKTQKTDFRTYNM